MATYLLDTNVLIRFCDSGSSSHTLALQSVSKLLARGEILSVTGQNLVEFWAVATRPLSANGIGWDPPKARSEVELILDQFLFLEDTPAVFAHWLHLVTLQGVSGKKVHDARLVAVMRAHGVTHLLTFNIDDFKNYTGITLVQPDDLV